VPELKEFQERCNQKHPCDDADDPFRFRKNVKKDHYPENFIKNAGAVIIEPIMPWAFIELA
jgi:hypothetical protein